MNVSEEKERRRKNMKRSKREINILCATQNE
jgi:hypothetical protein